MKNTRPFLILLLLSVMLTACAATPEASESTETVFSAQELARYNGENGEKAYIAVDGVVYDVTEVTWWENGQHNGFTAGKDLTEEMKTMSPHGTSKLNGLPVVGRLE